MALAQIWLAAEDGRPSATVSGGTPVRLNASLPRWSSLVMPLGLRCTDEECDGSLPPASPARPVGMGIDHYDLHDRSSGGRLVTSTHVVGFVGDQVLLCRHDASEVWFLPGGTREPGESVDHSLARELREEAGARLTGPFHRLGAHVGIADAGTHPYRSHLPHPKKAWLWGWAETELVGSPTNPSDGEQVGEVRVVDLPQAVRFAVTDNAWSGELIELAAELRGRWH